MTLVELGILSERILSASSRFVGSPDHSARTDVQRLSGVFEVRLYPVEFSIPVLLRNSVPDPVANSSGKLLVVTGAKRAVDVRKVEHIISQIDYHQVRERRQLFARLHHEARLSEEPGRGISFTSMLMMLAHNKLIDDEKALM